MKRDSDIYTDSDRDSDSEIFWFQRDRDSYRERDIEKDSDRDKNSDRVTESQDFRATRLFLALCQKQIFSQLGNYSGTAVPVHQQISAINILVNSLLIILLLQFERFLQIF